MEPNLRPGEDIQHYVERQAVEMRERASELEEAFAAAAATVTSRDGSVTVSLAPNGALRSIQLGRNACGLGEARLTTAIMETVRQAQSQTARAVASSAEAILGGGEAVEMMKSFLPPEPVADDGGADPNKFGEDMAPDDDPPPPPRPGMQPPRPPAPPPPPPRTSRPAPRRRPADDDEDEANPW
ncbi:YbaB/EbfC family nucleoid-associated protein [Amycolatopsis jiangsuensis]|uniref:DNA-binding protein YbaB n=1 Tax=Amycolatopsis jiangsuensis TaxID=1181879 RepID=A0A840IQN7_9PSEU|nr:YbaB/EbfC family nucleoid-associated protein [Amycolatopsis jiangsuensis]MBB4683859.1 DNA-binding protein YbaB [Amycolatopsis jiangsuensis]